MKPYLESLRRLSRIALILMVLCVAASIIIAMQYCTREQVAYIPSLREMYLPEIIFMFLGGALLALDGFSFLNKRADSDFYHSLPVARKRLFWSITLAALTWIAATVLAGVLASVIVYTVSHTPFVPLYGLIAVPFCIVGAMLVFAAASIAMSLTGTWISNIALTLLVLGLPRFVQFVVSRGILARFAMMTWLDLPWYLTPVSNIATGQIVSFTHNMLATQIYTLSNIGYSLLLAAVELIIGCLLFEHRSSELAEHGAKNANMQTVFACIIVFPVAILFVSGAVSPSLVNVLIIATVTLALYTIYQFIILRNYQKVLRSLPWALIPALLAIVMFLGIQLPINAFKYDVPLVQDVAYVQFSGASRANGLVSYEESQISKIKFTDIDTRDYVVSTLRSNVGSMDDYGYVSYDYSEGGNYLTYEPVVIVLNNGRKISRSLLFANSNTLNSIRDKNAEYSKAIRTLPPESTVCYRQDFSPYNEKYAQSESIMQTYYQDVKSTGLIPLWAYNQHSDTDYNSYNERQPFGSLSLQGYSGMQRYVDYYEIRLDTPNAASAWMAWQNSQSSDEYFGVLQQMAAQASSFLSTADYLNCTFNIYNVPLETGAKKFNSFYYSRSATDTTILNSSYESLANELIEIISRSTPTTDPNSLCVYLNWSGRAIDQSGEYIGADIIAKLRASSGNATRASASVSALVSWGDVVYYTSGGSPSYYSNDGSIVSLNPSYRSFSAADEARVIEILKEWQALQKELQFSYSDASSEDIVISGPLPTPTPVPTP